MSVVVERGLARCPRCVAVADYTFVESGLNSIRYEVHCRKCGEAYCEVNTPVAPDFTAAALALQASPHVEARIVGARRARAFGHLRRARSRVSIIAATVARVDWRQLLRRQPAEPTPNPPLD